MIWLPALALPPDAEMPVKHLAEDVTGFFIGLDCESDGGSTSGVCRTAHAASETLFEDAGDGRQLAAAASHVERIDTLAFP